MTTAMKSINACSLEENYDKPRGILKEQRYYFADKVHLVKAMVFPVVMHRCESWTIQRLSAEESVLSDCGAGKDS